MGYFGLGISQYYCFPWNRHDNRAGNAFYQSKKRKLKGWQKNK